MNAINIKRPIVECVCSTDENSPHVIGLDDQVTEQENIGMTL